MRKLNNWLTFIIIALFFVNLFYWFNAFYWFNTAPVPPFGDNRPIEKIEIKFDSHNLGWWYLILSLVILEIIFFILLFVKQKRAWEGWGLYTFKLKGLAFLYSMLLWVVVFPIVWLVQKIIIGLRDNWDKVKDALVYSIIVMGVVGLIGLWFLVNYLLTKKLGKEKKRLFKEGEKVRVRKDLVAWGGDFHPSMEKYRGKKATIKEYKYNAVYIKEDKGINMWREYMFKKRGRKRK